MVKSIEVCADILYVKPKVVWTFLAFLAIVSIVMPTAASAQAATSDVKRECVLDREVRCLIAELSGKAPESERAEAASDLAAALTTADPPLDPQTAQRVREAIVKALHDRSVAVRVATITALGEYGDESMIPVLYAVAKSDPILSVRDYTARAIARMRKRQQ